MPFPGSGPLFSQALSDDDEMISERLRALSKILNDMGY
ncbi:DUF6530 family protein [Paenibacillus aurantius]